MGKETRFVPLNSLRFVPVADIQNAQHHTRHFDNYLALEQMDNEVSTRPYAQPVENGQILTIYVDTTAASIVIEKYYNYNHQAVAYGSPINLSPTLVFPNNTYNGDQLRTYRHYLAVNNWDEGYYQFQITVIHPDLSSEKFISEVIHVRNEWKDTILYEVTSNKNLQDIPVLFEQIPTIFRLRFGGKLEYTPGGKSTVYTSYSNVQETLYASTWRNFDLIAGHKEPIMDWMVDKLAWYYLLPNQMLDGQRFSREENKEVEKQTLGKSSFCTALLKYRQYKQDTYVFENTSSLALIISQYPCAIPQFTMSIGTTVVVNTNTPKVFFDDTDLEAFKDEMNNSLISYGLTGSFVRADDQLLYNNGPGENYNAGNALMYHFLRIDIETGVNGQGWLFRFVNGGYNVVSWGDGSCTRQFSTSTSQVAHSRIFATADTYAVYIFHNPSMKQILINQLAYGVPIKRISGRLPSTLEVLDLRYTNQLADPVVDPTFIFYARFTIKTLIWSNTNITSFTVGIFSAGTTLTGSYGLLNYFDMRVGKLTQATIDQFFIQKIANTSTLPGSSYYVQSQTPAAPPTSSSLNQRQSMQVGYGCTIQTDI